MDKTRLHYVYVADADALLAGRVTGHLLLACHWLIAYRLCMYRPIFRLNDYYDYDCC